MLWLARLLRLFQFRSYSLASFCIYGDGNFRKVTNPRFGLWLFALRTPFRWADRDGHGSHARDRGDPDDGHDAGGRDGRNQQVFVLTDRSGTR